MPFVVAERRRGATVSLLLLVLLPVVIVLAFFTWNVCLVHHERSAQEASNDACVLAAAQALVDDRMLVGDAETVSNLQDLAREVARFYDTLNPLRPGGGGAARLDPLDDDFAFQTAPNPLDPNLTIVESIVLRGQRVRDRHSAVPIFGGPFFAAPNIEVKTVSKATLDRRVAGLRPVFNKPLPLSPIALDAAAWAQHVEATSPPSTWTVDLGSADVIFLLVGSGDANIAEQIADGVDPIDLTSLGGQFHLDADNGLDVPVRPGVDPVGLRAALESLVGQPRVWPLAASTSNGTANVSRLVAARIVSAAETVDPMTQKTSLSATLRPCFFSTPAAITEPTREPNPYLCRVRLVSLAQP